MSTLDTPLGFGLVGGLVLGVLERFILHFDLPTLAVAFVVGGVVLTRFGNRSSVDIGQALAVLGATGYVTLQGLVFVFG